jgi:peroxiredoxin
MPEHKPHVAGIFLMALSLSASLYASESPAMPLPAENFALLDQDGNFQELYYYSDKKGIVIISQGNGCPIVRKNVPYLRDLKEKYGSQGVEFLMINANPQDDRASLKKEMSDYNFNVPVLKDESQIVARSLGIERTAEALVIDPKTGPLFIMVRSMINLGMRQRSLNRSSITWLKPSNLCLPVNLFLPRR